MTPIRGEMNQAMESGCGVYREEGATQAALNQIAQLKGRYADLRLEDDSQVFNTELIQALELGNMLDVAETVAISALHRKESRGAHSRPDHPSRNDQDFLYHVTTSFEAGGPRLDRKAVIITRWQPEERKY